jgi:hypothetical protein
MPGSSRTTRAVAGSETQATDTTVELSADGGDYLTDGINLYRVVGQFDTGDGPVVGIEDCRTLDVVMLAVEDMPRPGLRRVVPES